MAPSEGPKRGADPECDAVVVHETTTFAHVVHVFDEVDIANAESLSAELSAITDRACVVVELSRCRYIDAHGLRVLVHAFRTYGERLRIVVRRETAVARVLSICALDVVLPIIYTDVQGRPASGASRVLRLVLCGPRSGRGAHGQQSLESPPPA